MTSDAKVGLLLGLVFIFVIAFIINGLPNFTRKNNNNELTTNMIRLQNDSLGVGARERKAKEAFDRRYLKPNQTAVQNEYAAMPRPEKTQSIQVSRDSIKAGDIRFSAQLPNKPQPGQNLQTTQISVSIPAEQISARKNQLQQKKNVKTSRTRYYTVVNGDSLAVIAKKFYGQLEGNREININRIYKANRRILKSRDEIHIGQKLVIPPLSGFAEKSGGTAKVLSSGKFEQVKSVGRRHSLNRSSKRKRVHIVGDGESLWKIAAKTLGDGNRYGEIAKLNASILEDEDTLVIGMRLKLPAR